MKNYFFLLLLAFYSSIYSQNFTLTSIAVNGYNDNYCGDFIPFTDSEEFDCTVFSGEPDLFVEITDASGSLIFQSSVNDNVTTLDLSLNLSLTNFPYSISVIDYDGVTSNDNLGNFNIDGSQTGTFTLSNNGTTITVNVMMSNSGCTDINAINFSSLATMNDGSCVYADCPSNQDLVIIDVQTDQYGFETSINFKPSSLTNLKFLIQSPVS